jgi:hypothetical protein
MEREKRKDKYLLRISKRETLYVQDEPEHTVSLIELIGEAIEHEVGVAGEFVSRRSITIQDTVSGSGIVHGYNMASFKLGSVYSRFEGQRDGSTKTTTGTWKTYLGTGKLHDIQGEGTFKVSSGERRDEYILELEGEYELSPWQQYL